MKAKEAREHVEKTFFALSNSGPIYRSDNIDMLQKLPPTVRKKFVTLRHNLAKKVLQQSLGPEKAVAELGQLLSWSNAL